MPEAMPVSPLAPVQSEPYLADSAAIAPPWPNRAPPEPELRRIKVEHLLWSAELMLGGNGRLKHLVHGSLADYIDVDGILHVQWDDYPRDVFMPLGDKYVSAGPATGSVIDVKRDFDVQLGHLRLPVAAISVQIPGTEIMVQMRLNSSDSDVFKAVFIDGEYEPLRFPFPVYNIVDLGANNGMSGISFSLAFPNAVIVSVEPDTNNMRFLKANTREFRNIIPVHAAIWPTDTYVDLRKTDNAGNALGDWGFQTLAARSDNANLVRAVSLPTLMREHRLQSIDLLKIDIEGAEKDLFEGDTDSWLPAVKAIAVETHERFRPGTDHIIAERLAADFIERPPVGELRMFWRKSLSDYGSG